MTSLCLVICEKGLSRSCVNLLVNLFKSIYSFFQFNTELRHYNAFYERSINQRKHNLTLERYPVLPGFKPTLSFKGKIEQQRFRPLGFSEANCIPLFLFFRSEQYPVCRSNRTHFQQKSKSRYHSI